MKTYGLIGNPVSHSWSANFFNNKFKREGLIAEYKLFKLDHIDEYRRLISAENQLAGLNVTIPFKVQVMPLLDTISDEAKAIGAVNTIVFKNGKTIGHNTDAYGFSSTLREADLPSECKAIVLGTGGASKAVIFELKRRSIHFIQVSRTPHENQIAYADISKYINSHQLIINCTPLGMFPNINEMPSLPFSQINDHHIIIDLIYNPEQTKLLRTASKRGAKTINGKTMLHQQALKAWELWQA